MRTYNRRLQTAKRWAVVVGAAAALAATGSNETPAPIACPRCGWLPPETRQTRTVKSVRELTRAIAGAEPHTTILIADGVYLLDRLLDVSVPDLVLRSKSGDPAAVTIRGNGMGDKGVGVALSIGAPRVTIADLTVGYVGYHGVQVRGERGASNVVLHNIHVVDTGQQLVKGSVAKGGQGPDNGLLACSRLEYSDHAPSDYTDGIDVLAGTGWVVRDNRFERIRGPEQRRSAGPAVLFWANSQNTIVERNVIVDCFRGIALGLGPGISDLARDGERRYDHQGGAILQNAISNLNGWADEGIEANAARDVRIDHNTVLIEGHLSWSISVRFPTTSGTVRNNLTNRAIAFRDGGQAALAGNVKTAQPDWFVDPLNADLRLSRADLAAIDAGVPVADIEQDFDRHPRVVGIGPDAGAFEYPVR